MVGLFAVGINGSFIYVISLMIDLYVRTQRN